MRSGCMLSNAVCCQGFQAFCFVLYSHNIAEGDSHERMEDEFTVSVTSCRDF